MITIRHPYDQKKGIKRPLKSVPVPSDIGRLPSSLADKCTASGFTAQQCMNYACIYACPCLVGLISHNSCISVDEVAVRSRGDCNETRPFTFLLEYRLKATI